MKSIKPGRGPSMMSGIASLGAGVFGLIWTIAAASMGAGIFSLFGLVFIGMAVASACYNFKNATSKNRYSTYDIVDGTEETDPFNERFGRTQTVSTDFNQSADAPTLFSANYTSDNYPASVNAFCPYCGKEVEKDFIYCNHCGKELPRDESTQCTF